MARGWESKSVEAQIDMAEDRSAVARAKVLSDVSLDLLRKKENILMSRTRVVRDLENAQNPRCRLAGTTHRPASPPKGFDAGHNPTARNRCLLLVESHPCAILELQPQNYPECSPIRKTTTTVSRSP